MDSWSQSSLQGNIKYLHFGCYEKLHYFEGNRNMTEVLLFTF